MEWRAAQAHQRVGSTAAPLPRARRAFSLPALKGKKYRILVLRCHIGSDAL